MASRADMAPLRRPVNAPDHRPARRLALAALVLLLGGCSLFETPSVDRGHRVDPADLAQITPGVQTRADVQALLGSPSARGTFDDGTWYYISSVTRSRPGRVNTMVSQRVVAISFDRGGVVQRIQELNESDRRDVAMVDRETPVPGNERTFLQTLFGNIGRLGPTQSGGGGPGAASP
jgi:outer membrane protein assembly factor BamE (lipoprotein component of BamABCDE complex)